MKVNKRIGRILGQFRDKKIDFGEAQEQIMRTIEREKQKKEREIVENIGQLRQWLNEKPKDMLVTNEHILEWLELKQPKE